MQLNPIDDSPLIIFDPLDEVDDSTKSNGKDQHNAKDKKENFNIKDGKLDIKYFEDQSLAKDYLCKICQFIVIDPREHNVLGTQSYACSSLFCHKCVINWIQSGKTCCPSPGCLTVDLDESSFREVGPRDFVRLSDLRIKCPFSCGSTTSYNEYYSAHQTQCPANPANRCKICEAPKVGPDSSHDCCIVFNEMRQKIVSLGNEIVKLNGIKGQLQIELKMARNDLKTKGDHLIEGKNVIQKTDCNRRKAHSKYINKHQRRRQFPKSLNQKAQVKSHDLVNEVNSAQNGSLPMKEEIDKNNKEDKGSKKSDSMVTNSQSTRGQSTEKKNQQVTENKFTCVPVMNLTTNGNPSIVEKIDKKTDGNKENDSTGNYESTRGEATKKKTSQQVTEDNSTFVRAINPAVNEPKQPFITYHSNCYLPSLRAQRTLHLNSFRSEANQEKKSSKPSDSTPKTKKSFPNSKTTKSKNCIVS